MVAKKRAKKLLKTVTAGESGHLQKNLCKLCGRRMTVIGVSEKKDVCVICNPKRYPQRTVVQRQVK